MLLVTRKLPHFLTAPGKPTLETWMVTETWSIELKGNGSGVDGTHNVKIFKGPHSYYRDTKLHAIQPQ